MSREPERISQMLDQSTIIFRRESPIRSAMVHLMVAGNANEPGIGIPNFGEPPGCDAQAAVYSSLLLSMVPARVESHAAMQPIASLRLLHPSPRAPTVVEPETSSKDLAEDVNHLGGERAFS